MNDNFTNIPIVYRVMCTNLQQEVVTEMGTLCPCGVHVDAKALRKKVQLNGCYVRKIGNLTYKADVCITKLAVSSLSLHFEDNETSNRYSFLFVANDITNVTCHCEGACCIVTVKGTGTIGGLTQYPFIAVFKDQGGDATTDIIQSFVIKDFFDQSGAVPVAGGSVVALGCQEV